MAAEISEADALRAENERLGAENDELRKRLEAIRHWLDCDHITGELPQPRSKPRPPATPPIDTPGPWCPHRFDIGHGRCPRCAAPWWQFWRLL